MTRDPKAGEPGGAEGNPDEVLYTERFRIQGNDYEHGGDVAARIKAILKQFGLDSGVIRRLSIANFEAEMNVIMYANEADLTLLVLPGAVKVVLSDRGQGIPDISLAMQEGWSTATPEMRQRGFGAGLGLPNIKRVSDEFEIASTVGVGTTLRYGVRFGS
jgi:serine/threonine-protein kinase RsbT